MTASHRPHRRPFPALALAMATLGLAACGDSSPQLPAAPEMSEWIDGDTATSSPGFTEGTTGDLVVRDARLETTEAGQRLTIVTEGEGDLGWRIVHSGLVMDASSFLSIDLVGLDPDHVTRVLTGSGAGPGRFHLSVWEGATGSGGLDSQPPVRYRYEQPDPHTLVVEVEELPGRQTSSHRGRHVAIPIDPTPPPWDGTDFTAPGDTLTSEGFSSAAERLEFNQPERLEVKHLDEQEVRLRFEDTEGIEWEASYVDSAADPLSGESLELAGDAILRVEFSGVGIAPDDDAVGFGVQTEDADTWVTAGADGGVVLWIGLPEAAPFTVVADPGGEYQQPVMAVAIER